MHDLITRLTRTYVPIAAGAIVAWLLTIGVEIDTETQASRIIVLTGLTQALYYTLVTYLARKFPKLEVLLGSKQPPEYNK